MIAALYDIHGNLPALEAVLEEIRGEDVDRIVVGGDVFPGPLARECLNTLLRLATAVDFIRGNGDRETLGLRSGRPATVPEAYREVLQWGANQLRPDDERVMSSWPATLRISQHGGRDLFFCHATPRNDTGVFTRLTPEEWLRPLFEGVRADLVVCGHTHMQFDRTIGSVRVVNAGSVGMPFGAPGADWLLIGGDIQFRHTSYDLSAAAERIRASGYPMREQFASTNVLNPPSEQQMLETFERAAASHRD